ncbi:hypothetical protein GGI07_000128 [Coemansia sp. Benny D115]|nr:hypothetical protein GGI07_000128 [Coemansia sp. Benny D115]
MKAAFLSASCLDYTSGTNINTSTKYEVYIDLANGNTTPLVASLSPSDIHLHPNYNPNTLENNIAVIEFNKQTTDSYKAYIVTDRYLVDSSSYIRRSYNEQTKKWNTPVTGSMAKNVDACSQNSGLLAANPYEIACTTSSTTSIYNSGCTVPFGTVYTRGTGTIGLIGIFSYAVIEGDGMCKGGTTWYSYFVKLWNTDRFATSVLGYPVDVLFQEKPTTEPLTSLYSNAPPTSVNMSGKLRVTGDLYTQQGAHNQDNSNSAQQSPVVVNPQPSPSSTPKSPEATNGSDDKNNNANGEEGNNTNTNDGGDDDNKTTKDSNNDNDNDGDFEENDNDTTEDAKDSSKTKGTKTKSKDSDDSASSGADENDYEVAPDVQYEEDSGSSNGGSSAANSGDSKNGSGSSSGFDQKDAAANTESDKSASSNDGLQRTQIIAIAVSVPVCALLLGFIALLLFRAWKAKTIKEKWDPVAEANHHREAIFELGGIEADYTPPPYERSVHSTSGMVSRASNGSMFKDVKM